MDPKLFFAELKRRNVYKVAVAWLLIQAASILFPIFEAPAWAVKIFVVVIVLGFPIALILAWAFELTPEGIKRTEDIDLGKSITRKTGRKLDFLIIAVLLLVITVLIFQRLHPNISSAVSSSLEKSIAVLPLENLSDEKQNAFFADGIQDELLTSLSKIKELKVISRTSVMQYKSGITRNIREIAQQLGVANVVEGSVRCAGNHIRVSVQLNDAKSDRHIWAENYDRTLADSISLQGELATEVANALRATHPRAVGRCLNRARFHGSGERCRCLPTRENSGGVRAAAAEELFARLHRAGSRQTGECAAVL